MRCINHSEREAMQVCGHCGRDFCTECLVDVNDGVLCKQCVAELAGRRGHKHSHARHDSCIDHDVHFYHRKPPKGYSKFMLFILNALPGLGYMYLGLIKRGLFVMSAFFLNIYLLAEFRLTLLAFLVPVIFFGSFFDSFRIRRLIVAGEKVSDSIDDCKDFVVEHKSIILSSLAVIIILSILKKIFIGGVNLLSGFSFGILPTLLLIAIAAYFFLQRKPRNSHKKYDENDTRDNYRQ